jgi:outer membrane receptor protein involved in Fe transport
LAFTANAGSARIRGGELEVSGRPLAEVPLSVQFGLGYADGVLLDPGLIDQDADTRLVQVPEWTGTVSGYYERPLAAAMTLFVSADYSYTGSVQVANGDNTFVTRQSFNIANGNIGVRFGRSQLMLYGKNLLDKRLNYGDLAASGFDRQDPNDTTRRLPRAAVSRPRQFGLQYRMDF